MNATLAQQPQISDSFLQAAGIPKSCPLVLEAEARRGDAGIRNALDRNFELSAQRKLADALNYLLIAHMVATADRQLDDTKTARHVAAARQLQIAWQTLTATAVPGSGTPDRPRQHSPIVAATERDL